MTGTTNGDGCVWVVGFRKRVNSTVMMGFGVVFVLGICREKKYGFLSLIIKGEKVFGGVGAACDRGVVLKVVQSMKMWVYKRWLGLLR